MLCTTSQPVAPTALHDRLITAGYLPTVPSVIRHAGRTYPLCPTYYPTHRRNANGGAYLAVLPCGVVVVVGTLRYSPRHTPRMVARSKGIAAL